MYIISRSITLQEDCSDWTAQVDADVPFCMTCSIPSAERFVWPNVALLKHHVKNPFKQWILQPTAINSPGPVLAAHSTIGIGNLIKSHLRSVDVHAEKHPQHVPRTDKVWNTPKSSQITLITYSSLARHPVAPSLYSLILILLGKPWQTATRPKVCSTCSGISDKSTLITSSSPLPSPDFLELVAQVHLAKVIVQRAQVSTSQYKRSRSFISFTDTPTLCTLLAPHPYLWDCHHCASHPIAPGPDASVRWMPNKADGITTTTIKCCQPGHLSNKIFILNSHAQLLHVQSWFPKNTAPKGFGSFPKNTTETSSTCKNSGGHDDTLPVRLL